MKEQEVLRVLQKLKYSIASTTTKPFSRKIEHFNLYMLYSKYRPSKYEP